MTQDPKSIKTGGMTSLTVLDCQIRYHTTLLTQINSSQLSSSYTTKLQFASTFMVLSYIASHMVAFLPQSVIY
jgi:hypothetical protein